MQQYILLSDNFAKSIKKEINSKIVYTNCKIFVKIWMLQRK